MKKLYYLAAKFVIWMTSSKPNTVITQEFFTILLIQPLNMDMDQNYYHLVNGIVLTDFTDCHSSKVYPLPQQRQLAVLFYHQSKRSWSPTMEVKIDALGTYLTLLCV